MRQTNFTGQEIYIEIQELKAREQDLIEACKQIREKCGRETVAYQEIYKRYEEVKKELDDFRNKKFQTVLTGQSTLR